ncbi:hypothetical protein GGR12_000216 [Brevundimonas lenta]|uniref:TIR domain-containing protein n=2 Tax=Brevundimonas lenta TaxID=424796 RepID=A0A7W6NNP9_9CAUL|nr:hypothetical protein [Brevundimonas lenta]
MLKRQGVIDTWHDRRIGPGENIHAAIDDHINRDQIILLLVSADFIASDYCYDIEMKRAMERHHAKEARVIPVILRACDWNNAPFGELMAVPKDGIPVTRWPDIDEALLQVAKAVRIAAADIASSGASSPAALHSAPAAVRSVPIAAPAVARSSNLRLAKTFTQRDRDQFQLETFEFIARYFENSLSELTARNPGFEGNFRKVDAGRFFATIYKEGKDVARATIYLGDDSFSKGINYIHGQTTGSNSMNESLRVEADEHSLHLLSMGMRSLGLERDKKLSQEGAAELYWSMLVDPLQQGSGW